MSKNAEWINKEYCFFICGAPLAASLSKCKVSAIRMQNLKTRFRKLCWGAAWLREAKIQHENAEIQFFSPPNIAPRKFSTPPNRHSALYLWAFRCIFHTRKKMKSGYTILSLADSQNVPSSNVFASPKCYSPTSFCYWAEIVGGKCSSAYFLQIGLR